MCRGNGIARQSFRMQAVRVQQRVPTGLGGFVEQRSSPTAQIAATPRKIRASR
jgi:hypothetical protein